MQASVPGSPAYTGGMISTDAATGTTIALKEWGAVVHALLNGRQTVLLRKGGIHEKAFTVADGGLPTVVFPTVAHSHTDRVRPEHASLLPLGAADVTDEALTIRCGLRIVGVVPVRAPDRLPEIADLHIWTADSVHEDRVAFRPKHALQVLVVAAVELAEPVVIPRLAEYGGCKSWVDLPVEWDGRSGRTAHTAARLAADLERVRNTVG
jgi:hypothetical protein